MLVRRTGQSEMGPGKPVRDDAATTRGLGSTASVRAVKAGVRRLARALGAGATLMAASVAASAADLVEVFELALTSDPEFLAAGADHRAARELLPQARAELRPRVRTTLDTRWNERQRRSDYRSDTLTLGIEHPLYHRDRAHRGRSG